MSETLQELSERLEHFETPVWCADEILEHELLTRYVVDPCTGTGILTLAAQRKRYNVLSYDIHNWGFDCLIDDYLKLSYRPWGINNEFSVFMNPPFSRAVEFVEKSMLLGARKILCFQRFSWLESAARKKFWDKHPPARVYVFGTRATCWRHDISEEERKRRGEASTAHAWFVWEKGQSGSTTLHRIYKPVDNSQGVLNFPES